MQPQPGASCVETQVLVWANATGGNETLTLQALRKYRAYRFRVAAYTSAGMGESTAWVYTHTEAGGTTHTHTHKHRCMTD